MIQYFYSGLYTPFYTTHDFPITDGEDVEYNRELLAEHYALDRDLKYQDEDDKWEQVDDMFWYDLKFGENVHLINIANSLIVNVKNIFYLLI